MSEIPPDQGPQQFQPIEKEPVKAKEVAPKMRFVIREGRLMEVKPKDLTIGEIFLAYFGSGGASLKTILAARENVIKTSKQAEKLKVAVQRYYEKHPSKESRAVDAKITTMFNKLEALEVQDLLDSVPNRGDEAEKVVKQIKKWLENKDISDDQKQLFFDTAITQADEETLPFLQENSIISKNKLSIFEQICRRDPPPEIDSPLFRVIKQCCTFPSIYHLQNVMQGDPALASNPPGQLVKAMLGDKVMPDEWLALLQLKTLPTTIKNTLLQQPETLARYQQLKQQKENSGISDNELCRMAWLLEHYFHKKADLNALDYTQLRQDLNAIGFSLKGTEGCVNALRQIAHEQKNAKLETICNCYTQLAESGQKTGRLTRHEALENALIIHHEVPKIFNEQIRKGKELTGAITLDNQDENARRIFWKARNVTDLTDIKNVEVYLSTGHVIGQGGIKMVTTGIKVDTTAAGHHIYTAEDLLAYQESKQSSPSDSANAKKLLTNQEVIESLAPISNIPNAPIVKTYFVTVFSTEKGQVRFGAFSELCEGDFFDRVKKNPTNFASTKTPFTSKNFTDCLNSLVIAFDCLHFLAMCRDQKIVHGDMKTENILLKKDKSGLRRGKGCDFDYTLAYKKIDAQVEALKKTREYGTLSQPEQEKWLQNKRKELEDLQPIHRILQRGTYGTPFCTSLDIKEGFDGSRDQSFAADCWAGGVVLFHSLTGGEEPPNCKTIMGPDGIEREVPMTFDENQPEIVTFTNDWTQYSESLKTHPAANIMNQAVAASLELAMKLFNPQYKNRANAKEACTELAAIIKTAYNAAKNAVDKDGKPIDCSHFATALDEINEFLNPSKPVAIPQLPQAAAKKIPPRVAPQAQAQKPPPQPALQKAPPTPRQNVPQQIRQNPPLPKPPAQPSPQVKQKPFEASPKSPVPTPQNKPVQQPNKPPPVLPRRFPPPPKK